MAVRPWSKEIAAARRLIERVIRGIDDAVKVTVDGGAGFANDTVEVMLRKGDRRAIAIVTFEAWSDAEADPREMEQAFREVIAELASPEGPRSSFLVTSTGLVRRALRARKETLRDAAASWEAEKQAERLLGGIG